MSRVRSVSLLAAVVALWGCYRWSAPQPAAQSALRTHPAELAVTLTDGRQFLLGDPRIEGDSLRGDTLVSAHESGHVAIPLGNVGSVSTRQLSPGRTALLVVAIPIGGLVVVALLSAAVNGCCVSHVGL